jgi:HlyD family secretion protein
LPPAADDGHAPAALDPVENLAQAPAQFPGPDIHAGLSGGLLAQVDPRSAHLMTELRRLTGRHLAADPADFAPPLLRIQQKPPAPLAGWMLRLMLALVAGALLWAYFGRLDIVAVAEGKLVPASYVKIVQPAEQGIVREILVREGEQVAEGQVLMRMDPVIAEAELRALQAEYERQRLGLRRIEAELSGRGLEREPGDSPVLFAQVAAQQAANVRAHESALAQERAVLEKARHDLAAAEETRAKLQEILPHYREQEAAFERLAREGFAGRILAAERRRERIEREQELRAQEHLVRSNLALIEQAERRLAQLSAEYRRRLQAERLEVSGQLERLSQELARQRHRRALLELRAPAAGTVKDLATHTAGTVAAPGTILMTLVPNGEKLLAEVWVGNADAGFVRAGQPAKLKLAPFPFHRYGLIEARVLGISADASELPAPGPGSQGAVGRALPAGPLAYRALLEPAAQHLEHEGGRYALAPGMQLAAEIHLGTRTLLEYLLSPLQRAFHEAARER